MKIFLFFMSLFSLATSPAQAKMVVIAHPEIKVEPTLEQIRQIYLGKLTSLDGKTPLEALDIAADSPLRTQFLDLVVQKSQGQLNQYWSRLVFTGKAVPPRKVASDQAVIEWVAQNKGAIGIIDSKLLNEKVNAIYSFREQDLPK